MIRLNKILSRLHLHHVNVLQLSNISSRYDINWFNIAILIGLNIDVFTVEGLYACISVMQTMFQILTYLEEF